MLIDMKTSSLVVFKASLNVALLKLLTFLFVGYRERLTMPILEISASGDEFLLCDDNIFWWDGIPSRDLFLL